jgi:protein TonB
VIDRRIAICVAISIAGHLLAGEALSVLPERASMPRPRTVEVRVVAPPPPAPEPEPEPEPPKPEPPKPEPPKVVEPRPQPRVQPARPASPAEPPPTQPSPAISTTAATDSPVQPVFGVTMESTSSGGNGPAVPVGNTTSPAAPTGPAPATSSPPAAPAHEVTKMPMPRGRCSGTYTDAAHEAGIEGVVVLDLVVDEHGRARDIAVVEGLPHGLTEAAVAALRACHFDPGEGGGAPVPVRVRGFKIRFVLGQ